MYHVASAREKGTSRKRERVRKKVDKGRMRGRQKETKCINEIDRKKAENKSCVWDAFLNTQHQD